jgi:predicted transcriptional regulator
LAACLALNGAVAPKAGRGLLTPRRSANGKVEPGHVLQYLQQHPGSRAEDIASALGTDAVSLRPSLQELRAAATVRAEGKARATRYFVKPLTINVLASLLN